MSLHTLANHLQSAGRGQDKVLVHMTPGEVNGLQSLAMAHGGSLTINPETGLPEAGFLSRILPMVAGAALTVGSGGTLSPLVASMMVGGATAVATGSLKNGLLAGLGAYGGAGLGTALGAGAAGSLGAANAAGVTAAQQAANLQLSQTMAGGAASAAAPAAAVAPAAIVSPTADALARATGTYVPPAAPVVPTSQLAYSGGIPPPPISTTQIAQGAEFAKAAKIPAVDTAVKSQGMFGGMDFSKLVNPDFIKDNKEKYLMAMAPLLMEEERRKKEAQAASQMQLGGTPVYSPSVRAPGGSSERLYFANGGLADLPIEKMSQQNALGANTNYPMSNLKPYGYAVPRNNPISQNVLQPNLQNTNPYTGEQKFADGGIAALKSGGSSKQKPAISKGQYGVAPPEVTSEISQGQYRVPTKSKQRQAEVAAPVATPEQITQFKEETKRSSGLQPRGLDTKGTQPTGDTAAIQAKIDAIKKSPAGQSGMGGMGGVGSGYLSTEQQKQIKTLEGQLSMAKQGKVVYDPKSGQYVPEKVTPTYQKLTKVPGLDTTKKIMEENDIRRVYEEQAGRSPTSTEMNKYVGKKLSEADVSKNIGTLAELTMPQKFGNDDLNQQAQYYWGRDMTKGELAYFKDPANKITNFNNLRNSLMSSDAYLQNLNKINQAAFTTAQKQALVEEEGPASMEQIASYYQDVFGKPPTMQELIRLKGTGLNISALQDQIKGSEQYQQNLIKPFVPAISTPAITQDQINAYRAQQIVPQAVTTPQPSPYIPTGPNVSQYDPFAVQPKSTIEGALPYADISQRLGLTNLYSQLGEPGINAQKSVYGLPAAPSGLTAAAPNIFGFGQYPTVEEALKAAQASRPMASGGIAGYNLGGYSDGGRLLRGPGDGVSDSIPASIGDRQPARLADGEFVVPARIVSELGNGSTEAGARKLYAMMDRVQRARSKTVGKNRVAVNSRAEKMLPA